MNHYSGFQGKVSPGNRRLPGSTLRPGQKGKGRTAGVGCRLGRGRLPGGSAERRQLVALPVAGLLAGASLARHLQAEEHVLPADLREWVRVCAEQIEAYGNELGELAEWRKSGDDGEEPAGVQNAD